MTHLYTFSIILLSFLLVACGGSKGSDKLPVQEPPIVIEPIEEVPANTISHAYFRDQDSATDKIAGAITIEISAIEQIQQFKTESIWVYWADADGNKLGSANDGPWLRADSLSLDTSSTFEINIPVGTVIPSNMTDKAKALILYPRNGNGEAEKGTLIKFHDFIGNAQLSGPGGNYLQPWYYGVPDSDTDIEGDLVLYTEQRTKISIHRNQSGLCSFDNGLVSIIDMNYTRDEAWEAGKGSGPNAQANEADDNLFPIYEYPCAENPINTHRYIGDEEGAWLYSTINDAMFYGTIVYDTYVKYLGEPPINDKLRIRVHYGSTDSTTGYWDGAYATFGDGIPLQLSASSLDSIGHEVGHGVLNRLMGVDFFQPEASFSKEFRTLHEAFSDISGVMAWYELVEQTGEYTGETNYWLHGEENQGYTRKLDQIKTESQAIPSMLDYDETEGNYYLSIGMFSYPFYLLQQQWGMEAAYSLYIDAARNCWTPIMSHTQIAQCLVQRAERLSSAPDNPAIDVKPSSQKIDDVIAAFKTVKIKLFDEGILSHFFEPQVTNPANSLVVQFTDDSRSTGTVNHWLWDFGDGTTSTEQNPSHTYSEAKTYTVTLTVTNAEYSQDASNATYHKDEFSRKVKVVATEN